MSNEKVLIGARVVRVGTLAGPFIYKVEALWHPSPGWVTVLTTHDPVAASRRGKELIEGIDATDNTDTVWEWYDNNHHAMRHRA